MVAMAQEKLTLVNYTGYLYDKSYLDLKYEIGHSTFVSDTLMEGVFFYKHTSDSLAVFYYPRGYDIQLASEGAKWPILLRKIFPNEMLHLKINLINVLKELEPDTNRIILVICDFLFNIDVDNCQFLFYPEDYNIMKKIVSDELILLRDADGYWSVEELATK
jgi:hypothetical protein